MNKKASFELAGEMVIWFFRIFMLVIVVVTLALIVNAYVSTKIDTSKLEHKIIIDKVMMQSECVNAYDGVRWVPYSISIDKFNSLSLSNCIISGNIGLSLKLRYDDRSIEARYNDRLLGYFSFCEKKSKSFSCSKGSILVKVFDNGAVKDGLLDYEVITGNE